MLRMLGVLVMLGVLHIHTHATDTNNVLHACASPVNAFLFPQVPIYSIDAWLALRFKVRRRRLNDAAGAGSCKAAASSADPNQLTPACTWRQWWRQARN